MTDLGTDRVIIVPGTLITEDWQVLSIDASSEKVVIQQTSGDFDKLTLTFDEVRALLEV
jgi:hypothetical protein